MNALKLAVPITIAAMLFTSCKKDKEEPATPTPPVNEEEVFTTVLLTLTNMENTSEVYELRFKDVDGEGGADPEIIVETLPANVAFSMAIRLFDESQSPTRELTAEVGQEGAEHQFFFHTENVNMNILYADQDANGHPIGLLTTAICGTASSGTLKVTLRHGPDKGGDGVAQGDITNAGGETDLEVEFPVVID